MVSNDAAGTTQAEAVAPTWEGFRALPGGPPLFDRVPARVFRVDELAHVAPSALVDVEESGMRGAAVVVDGGFLDGVVAGDGRLWRGERAWRLMGRARDGCVSLHALADDLARVLPILWRCRAVQAGLDKRQVNPWALVDEQRRAEGDRAVVVSGAADVGVVLLHGGDVTAAYTSADPLPRTDITRVLPLFAEHTAGGVWVLERVASADSRADAEEQPVSAWPPQPEAPRPPARPAARRDGQAFSPAPRRLGPSERAQGEVRRTVQPPAPRDLEAVIEELLAISGRTLGPRAPVIAPLITSAERSPAGLRRMIAAVSHATVPDHPPEQVAAMARSMLLFVAEHVGVG